MSKAENLKLVWYTTFSELKAQLDRISKPDRILLVKFAVIERDIIEKTTKVLEHLICPAEVRVKNDKIAWTVNDKNPMNDSLYFTNSISDISKSNILGGMVYADEDTPSSEKRRYVTFSIVTAFTVIDTCLPALDSKVRIQYNDNTEDEITLNASSSEIYNITEYMTLAAKTEDGLVANIRSVRKTTAPNKKSDN